MKKILMGVFLLSIIILTENVYASNGTMTIKSDALCANTGETIEVTVEVEDQEILGSWQFNLNYDNTKLELLNGDSLVVGIGDGKLTTKSYTYLFKALNKGPTAIYLSNEKMVNWNEMELFTPSTNQLFLNIYEFLLGDVTRDGIVDLTDVMYALRISLGLTSVLDEDIIKRGNINKVDGIDLTDVLDILRIALQLQ